MRCLLFWLPWVVATSGAAGSLPSVAPPYYQVIYPASTNEGALKLSVHYTVWVPPGVKTLRGLIVHQHGCGEGACQGGATAAYDWHWQALARKWDCALLGPSYQQREQDDCTWWSDPRNGSEQTFLRALADLAGATGHPELERVPWALWGHSGGANWVGTLLLLHPERIMAVWLRSGSPRLFSAKAAGSIPEPSAAALSVPVMCNLGVKEKEGRFIWIWDTTFEFFKQCRAKGALIGVAVDPRTSHECGDARYLAIPWLDACLAQRLPVQPGQPLRRMPEAAVWLAALSDNTAQPAAAFTGDKSQSIWLPSEAVARAWSDYVKTGATADLTPPPPPRNVRIDSTGALIWEAEVDFESGLAGFVIERDGVEVARLPEKPAGPFGRPLFQGMSYHDTPERPLPELRFLDKNPSPGTNHQYGIRARNGAGLLSTPCLAVERSLSAPR